MDDKYYKITPSLYSSWYWYKAIPDDQHRTELLNALRKVPFAPNDAMKKGIAFEDKINKIVLGKATAFDIAECRQKYPAALLAADRLKEMAQGLPVLIQQKMNTTIDVGRDKGLYISGILDVLLPDRIVDIKRTVRRPECGKYDYSIQHYCYMAMTGILDFTYLIGHSSDIYELNYRAETVEEAKRNIAEAFNNMYEDIYSNIDFAAAYHDNWVICLDGQYNV